MDGPNPGIKHPIPMHKRVGFLKPLVTAPNIEIGDFTYYDDPDGPDSRLLTVAWRDWPVDKINRNLNAIRGADILHLEAAV